MDLEALKQSFLKKFQEDTGDRLQKIQHGVLGLEKSSSAHAAELVARELHTMKGEARILGLAALGQLAHAAEDVLHAERERKIEVPIATELLLKACDAAAALLADLQAAKSGSKELSELCAALSSVSGQALPPLAPADTASARSAPPSTQARGLARPLSELTALERVPAPSQPVLGGPSTPKVEPAREKNDARPQASAAKEGPERSIRVAVESLDAMGLSAGDLLVESARTKLRSSQLARVLERFSRLGDHFLRLHRTSVLEDEAREQLEALETELHSLRDDAFRFMREYEDGLDALHGNLLQLADHVGRARLVPLSSVFAALPRAARDMALSQGKVLALSVADAGLGVDRSMVQDLRDALVHLLRNAVDHGLEAPSERAALGKPEKGTVSIRVHVDGDMLHLDVEDDGRGIDPEHLRQVAVSRGLIGESQAQALSEREALELIFLAGFSTREEVNEWSGRGVGMDVVKQKVEALGGSVTLESRPGRGTNIQLRLPQSLALMRVLLVRLGGDVYGIPAADVEAVIRVNPADQVDVLGTLSLQHRGEPVALVPLGAMLGLNGGPAQARTPAVVVRLGAERAALAVDGFVGEREVAVKPCGGEFLKGLPFVAGSAALEDGRIAVLLKVPDVMSEVRRVARVSQHRPATRRLRILLVDDSPIARGTESALLRALGHHVDEAKDGQEGLQKAQTGTYELIVSDVQMPRMDGLALARSLKADARTARTPLILLSSLGSDEDRRRGAEAGADAYLVKAELGVELLARTLEQVL